MGEESGPFERNNLKHVFLINKLGSDDGLSRRGDFGLFKGHGEDEKKLNHVPPFGLISSPFNPFNSFHFGASPFSVSLDRGIC